MVTKWIHRILLVLLAIFMVVILVGVGGEAVLQLWNWLLPSLFGWKAITFWQAVGILTLCRILFGRLGGRPLWRQNFRRRMNERWEHMTPEERERFQHGIRSRCGGVVDAPAAVTKEQA